MYGWVLSVLNTLKLDTHRKKFLRNKSGHRMGKAATPGCRRGSG